MVSLPAAIASRSSLRAVRAGAAFLRASARCSGVSVGSAMVLLLSVRGCSRRSSSRPAWQTPPTTRGHPPVSPSGGCHNAGEGSADGRLRGAGGGHGGGRFVLLLLGGPVVIVDHRRLVERQVTGEHPIGLRLVE